MAAADDKGPAGAPFRKSALRENFESVILAVLFALFVRTFIAQPYKIPSGSMEDSLLVGDHLVVNKAAFGSGTSADGPSLLPTREVKRGDVIIFRPPPVPGITDETTDYIKRVIGLPGDDLTLVYDPDRDGVRVHVNGSPLPENWRTGHFGAPHLEKGAKWTVTFDGEPPERRYGWMTRSFHLGADQFLVMGDNRNDSADSRFWGDAYAVSGERIRGSAWFVYWSYDVGEDPPEPKSLVDVIKRYAQIAVTFPVRSRWQRTLMPIR